MIARRLLRRAHHLHIRRRMEHGNHLHRMERDSPRLRNHCPTEPGTRRHRYSYRRMELGTRRHRRNHPRRRSCVALAPSQSVCEAQVEAGYIRLPIATGLDPRRRNHPASRAPGY